MSINDIIAGCEALGVALDVREGTLRLSGNTGSLAEDLIARIRAHKPELIAYLGESNAVAEEAEHRVFPLTSTQQDIWLDCALHGTDSAYHMLAAFRLQGAFDRANFDRALRLLRLRHEALRVGFCAREGVPEQRLFAASGERLRCVDLSDAHDPLAEAEALVDAERTLPFDLAAGRTLRATLATLDSAGTDHLLLIDLHHIVADGVSVATIVQELAMLYNAALREEPARLPALTAGYADAVRARSSSRDEARHAEGLAFFRDLLEDAPPVHAIATDRARPESGVRSAGELRIAFDRAANDALLAFARTARTTPFVAFKTLFVAFLARWCGTADVVLGTPHFGRRDDAEQALVGCFLNMLPCRYRIAHDATLEVAVGHVRDVFREIARHADVECADIVRHAARARATAAAPLFQIVFSMQEQNAAVPALEGLQVEPMTLSAGLSKFDLSLRVETMAGDTELVFEYDAGLFAAATMAAFADAFAVFAVEALRTPLRPLRALPLMREDDALALAARVNAAPAGQLYESSLFARFAETAARHADRIALVCGERSIDYRTLSSLCDAYARRLREAGVRAGDRVGLAIERSPAHIVAMLACVRIGAAYVPIDPEYPRSRIQDMLEAVAPRLLVAGAGASMGAFATLSPPTLDAELLAEEALLPPAPADVAGYLMFTSGSTGRPKPIEIPQRGVLRLVCDQGYVDFGPEQALLHASSPSFDASTFEIWGALLHGARLVIAPPQAVGLRELRELIERHGVTTAWFTAGLYHNLIDHEIAAFAGLRQVLAGGDALSVQKTRTLREAFPSLRIVNGYGPTENTTFTCVWEVGELAADATSVPIGRPLRHASVYLLDDAGQVCPQGMVGELYASGEGVAAGYPGYPALTADAFLPNPFDTSPVLYRTGDLARLRADGTIEFVGRRDQQVKVRGFRVELGAIVAALEACAGVRQAVAMLDRGRQRIVAYVESDDAAIAPRLRATLAATLPDYMRPSTLVSLPRLPLTANGKLDLRALPEPGQSESLERIPPRSRTERLVCVAFAQVLRSEEVGIDDSLFDLGGHSIDAAQIAARIERECGIALPMRVLLARATPRLIAQSLDAMVAERGLDVRTASGEQTQAAGEIDPGVDTVVEDAPSTPLSLTPLQRRIWLSSEKGDPLAYTIPGAFELRGPVDPDRLQAAIDAVALRHPALRIRLLRTEDGEPQQNIAPLPALALERRQVAADAFDAETRAFVREGVPLDGASLYRFALLSATPTHHLLLVNAHHIVSDGWSLNLIAHALMSAYRDPAPLVDTAARMEAERDYRAVVQHAVRAEASDRAMAALDYWADRLRPVLPQATLPTDFLRDPTRAQETGDVAIAIDAGLRRRLEAVCAGHGATLFTGLIGLFGTLQQRWSAGTAAVLGYPHARRSTLRDEGVVGAFADTSLCLVESAPDTSFASLLRALHAQRMDNEDLGQVPYEPLLRKLDLRPGQHAAPFQVFFNLVNLPQVAPMLGEAAASPRSLDAVSAKFDLALYVRDRDGALEVRANYDATLFRAETIRIVLAQYAALLAQAVATPDAPLSAMSLRLPTDASVMPDSAAALGLPSLPSMDEWLCRAFAEHAPRPAIVHGSRSLTYAGLERCVALLAGAFAAAGVAPGDLVAIHGGRSERLIAAMLAAWRAGAAFVVLDSKYPDERLRAFLQAAPAKVCLLADGDAEAPAALGEACDVLLDFDRARAAGHPAPEIAEPAADAIAYVGFTSGSSGVPKAVLGTRRSFAAFAGWFIQTHALCAEDRFSALSGVSHDPFHRDALLPLLVGASVHVPDEAQICADLLGPWFREARITVCNITPTVLQLLCAASPAQRLESLRHAFVVGEPLDFALADAFRACAPSACVSNLYGATEMHWALGAYRLPTIASGAPRGRVPVGTGIDGAQLLVLRPDGGPCGVGEIGEIVVRSPYAPLGYSDPALDAARYVREPSGAVRYRTGDLGRYDADGIVHCLGRLDRQVKIGGVRIELGEIDHWLRRFPGIVQAVTVDAGEGAQRALVAFAVPGEGVRIDPAQVLAFLAERLPLAARPRRIVLCAALPLGPNRKIDYRRLREEASAAGPEPGRSRVAPVGPGETVLIECLAGVLRVDPETIGCDDDFFMLGGHSIHAAQLVSRLHARTGVRLSLRQIFRQPILRELAAELEWAPADACLPSAVPAYAEDAATLPLTFLQRKFYVQETVLGTRGGQVVPLALEIDGALDLPRLEAAISDAILRHAALRVRIEVGADGEPVQRIHDASASAFRVVDLPASQLNAAVSAEFADPVALDAPALFRFTLLRAGARQVLTLVLHHLIADGWSVAVLIAHIRSRYLGAAAAPAGDYAAFVKRSLASERDALANLDRAYWRGLFEDLPGRVDFGSDLRRIDDIAGSHRCPIDAPTLHALHGFAATNRVTPFAVVAAAFHHAVSSWTGQKRYGVAMPVHAREDVAVENTVGCLIATRLLRVELSDADTFLSLLQRSWETQVDALQRQELPHEMAANALGLRSDNPTGNWYNLLISHQNTPQPETSVPGATIRKRSIAPGFAKLDLAFVLSGDHEALDCEFLYDTGCFSAASIASFAQHFLGLLRAALRAPERPLRLVVPIPAADEVAAQRLPIDRPMVLDSVDFPGTMLRAIRETPDTVCAVFGERTLTFRELGEHADRVSAYLFAQGVRPGDRVGVMMGRSVEMLTALVGLLQAGVCYVPLDPDYPERRLRFIVEDSGITALVRESRYASSIGPAHIAAFDWERMRDEMRECAPLPALPRTPAESPAYIMYTSGTTGTPKGVCVTFGGLVNHIHAAVSVFGFRPGDRVLQLNTINFDISVEEIFPTLASGACVVFYPEAKALSADGLVRIIGERGVTVLNFTTALWRELVLGAEVNVIEKLRCMIVGGEEIKPVDLELWRRLGGDGVVLFNTYGPTEITVFCSYWRYEAGFQAVNRCKVPIGGPVPNYRLYVLDPHLNLCPVGAAAELFVGGVGVAQGYINNPRITAERFLPDPYGPPGSRMYRTGDYVRINDAGHVVYLGRKDGMVKINGFRVELAEIEAVALGFGRVSAAVAVARRDDGIARLTLYVVDPAFDARVEETELRMHLKRNLPPYMLPHDIVALDRIPLNDNRKIDFAALPLPVAAAATIDACENPLEETLLRVWSETFPGLSIGRHSNFFELGGDSLRLIRLHKRLCAELGREVDVVDVFRHQTIAEFARHLETSAGAPHDMAGTAESGDSSGDDRMNKRRAALDRRARKGEST